MPKALAVSEDEGLVTTGVPGKPCLGIRDKSHPEPSQDTVCACALPSLYLSVAILQDGLMAGRCALTATPFPVAEVPKLKPPQEIRGPSISFQNNQSLNEEYRREVAVWRHSVAPSLKAAG